ncbi:MAG: radical SAM protein [Halobacteriovoraceae bacterium]|nr:radical SAM protein [Halobacteriovoraceae bacterium]
MKIIKPLIIFPPISEARLFPYGALPHLCGFLKSIGYDSKSIDLNLKITEDIVRIDNVKKTYLKLDPHNIKELTRRKLIEYYLDNYKEIKNILWNNQRQDKHLVLDSGITAIELTLRVFELLTESAKSRCEISNFSQLNLILESNELNTDQIIKKSIDFLSQEIQQGRNVLCFTIPYFSQLLPTLYLSKQIKKLFPQLKIILGGHQIYLYQNKITNINNIGHYIDAICPGRGEKPLEDYLNYLDGKLKFEKIQGLIFPNSKLPLKHVINYKLDSLPPPSYEGLEIFKYLSEKTQLGITTCFGCSWGKCDFCSYGNRKYSDGYDQYSQKKLAEICLNIYFQTGISRINFVDENTNIKLVHSAATKIRSTFPISYSVRGRLDNDLLDEDYLHSLKDSGLVLYSSGLESLDQFTLDKMNKGVNSNNFQKIIDKMNRVGIPLRLSVMMGHPTQTPEDHFEMKRFLKKNEDRIGIDVTQVYICEPNSFMAQNFSLGDELENNRVLNYEGGRVGLKMPLKTRSQGQFDQALNSLIMVNNEVRPLKNYGFKRFQTKNIEINSKMKFQLNSWIIPIEEDIHNFMSFYDCIKQKKIKVPWFSMDSIGQNKKFTEKLLDLKIIKMREEAYV